MKWRWCVCDLDGTLLDPQGNLAAPERAALARLSAAGCELVLATGRLDLMARRFAHELQVSAPIIGCNGGLIREPDRHAAAHLVPLPPALAARARRHLEARGQGYLLYTADAIHLSAGNPRRARLERYNAGSRPEHRVALASLEEYDRLPGPPPAVKLLVNEAPEGLLAELEALVGGPDGLALVVSERGAVDVTAPGTSKGAGLEVLARLRGLDLSRTIAFGDHHNDLSMLERCGLPIAMGNAEPEVKRAAAWVTRTNAESGVAHALEELVLRGPDGAG